MSKIINLLSACVCLLIWGGCSVETPSQSMTHSMLDAAASVDSCIGCSDQDEGQRETDYGSSASDAQSSNLDVGPADSDAGDAPDMHLNTDIQRAQCGNGVVESAEVCDDGNTVTEGCAYGETSCTVCASDCTEVTGQIRTCGDDVLDTEEECDDGNTVTEGCAYGASGCTVCAGDCTEVAGQIRTCGDEVLDAEEECDDGNTATEGCVYGETSCMVCADNCTETEGVTRMCGDGVVDSEEGCDDANEVDADRCTDTCVVNQFCPALPGQNNCAPRDNYTPGVQEHNMVSIDGCDFALAAPTAATLTFGNQRVEALIARTNGERSIDDVLADLNRSARRGITNYNAQRLRNHSWFGFNWDGGDSDVSYWYPQGITGSSDARPNGYVSGRRVVLVSWYHKTEARPTKGVRVSLADLTDPDDINYRHILLVEPFVTVNGDTDFKTTETESGNALHAGGIVWYGNYLFVADTAKGIRVFDFGRLIEVSHTSDTGRIGLSGGRSDAHGYKYMAVQVARYAQPEDACYFNFSALGLDLSSNPPTMITSEYRSGDPQGRLVHWPVDVETGLLLDIDGQVRGRDAQAVAQDKIQGALSWQGNYYISSSSQYQNFGRLYRTRPGLESRITAWVYGAEDLYYERTSGLIWTAAEHPDFRDTVGIPLLIP
jgi:cysteine-rich repeat protein